MKRNEPEQAFVQNRREFMKIGGVATAALLAQAARPAAGRRRCPTCRRTRRRPGPCPRATSAGPATASGSSASAASRRSSAATTRRWPCPIVERALDLGVNYIDTSSIYGGPERWSERYIGQVMKRRRAEAFLASKTKERTRDGSLRMLEQSLRS